MNAAGTVCAGVSSQIATCHATATPPKHVLVVSYGNASDGDSDSRQGKFTRSLAVELQNVLRRASSYDETRVSGVKTRSKGIIVLEEEQSSSSGWFLKNAEGSSGWSFRPANCGA